MVPKKTHLDPVDLVQISSKENTKKQKKSTTEAPPSGHRYLLHPLPPNEEKQVHSKNLSLRNTFGTTSLILLALTLPLSLHLSFSPRSVYSLFPSFPLPLIFPSILASSFPSSFPLHSVSSFTISSLYLSSSFLPSSFLLFLFSLLSFLSLPLFQLFLHVAPVFFPPCPL